MPLCASAHASLSVAQVFVGFSPPAPSLVNSMVFETYIIDFSGICQAVKPCSLVEFGGVFNTSYDNGCGNVLPPSAGPSVAHRLLLHMMNLLIAVTLSFPGSSLVFMLVFNAVAAMTDGRGSSPVCVRVALCPLCFQPSLGFAAMLWYQVGLCVASACPAYVEFCGFLFPVAFVGKASVRITNKIKGKDRSESKLRSFVTWFCSFPLPQMVTCGLQSAAAHVYLFCQIVSAAAFACGAQFAGFGIQSYMMVSAGVFVLEFHFSIEESYLKSAAALRSVEVQIVAAARLVSAAASAASFGIITLLCAFVIEFLLAIVESYVKSAAALRFVDVQIVAAARLVSAVALFSSFGIFTLVDHLSASGGLGFLACCKTVSGTCLSSTLLLWCVSARHCFWIVRVANTFAFGHAAAALDCFLTLVDGATWSMGITTKGSSYAATAAASPRVDVEKTPQAAAAPKYLLSSSGHVWTEFRGLPGPGEKFLMVEDEGKHGGGNWEKPGLFLRLCCVLGRIFGASQGGKGRTRMRVLQLRVAAKVNIPERHWSLTFLGKDLRHASCLTSVLHRDSTIRMCSRLLGGAPLQPTPGEWFCPACNRGGCWASRRTCFRCLTPRPAGGSTPLQPQSRGRNQRERRALGRDPVRSPNQCPTERRPPVSPPGCQCSGCPGFLFQWQSKAASAFFQTFGCHFDS